MELHQKLGGIMASIKMKLGYEQQAIELSCNFIEHYMTSCPPVYSLIYIMGMKKLMNGEGISIAELALQFNITESDVMNAWRHWENVGIVKLEDPDNNMAITFYQVHVPEHTPAQATQPIKHTVSGSRPQYTIDELTVYRKQSRDVARMFERAEQTLGKLLYYNDLSVIFSFHDWLRLPIDVIEYLLTYCAENGHRNLRYIEKCALDWADNGVDDLEKALIYVQAFDKNYRTILHYMGQTSGYPTPSHRKYIDKWIDTWKMPLDLVMEACDRSVAAIDKPTFAYVNKILSEWDKKDVRDIEGVKALDAEFAKSKETPTIVSIDKKVATPKVNRFVNFTQREHDYAKLEQLERAYLEQKLK